MCFAPLINDGFIKQIETNNYCSNLLLDCDYCIIFLKGEMIVCSYFYHVRSAKVVCQINFYASSGDVLFSVMAKHQFLFNSISFTHALYIGKEVYKAQMSKVLSQSYIQT